MRLFLLFTCLILCYSQCVQSARILGVFPIASYSHYTLASRLMKELAVRGHDVTMLSPYTEKNPIGKYKSIELPGFLESMEEFKKTMNFFEMSASSKFSSVITIHSIGSIISKALLENPGTQKLLKSNEKFDLVMFEQFGTEQLFGLCHHYKAPCVAFHTIGATYWTNLLVGNPTNPSYIPEMALNHAGPMDFWKRVENTALALFSQAAYKLYFINQQDAYMHEFFPTAPPLYELMLNTSLVLLNSHVSTAQVVPHVPNMIEIGGFHPQLPKKLPEDLQKYLDGAKEGVIFFSMGSNLKSAEIPQQKRKAILNTFAKLKMKVLWKFEEELPGKPANVKISNWLPQQDLLAHPNVKLFITHGGLLSTIEAIYHGVPVVGVPVYGDQSMNMVGAVNGGFAEVVDYNTLTEERFLSTINTVLNNKRYSENAKLRSRLMHDRPMKPLDTAMFWLEYVIRNKGAPELRSEAMNLTWYQYFLLDVIAFMVVVPTISLYVFYIICKKMLRRKRANTDKKSN